MLNEIWCKQVVYGQPAVHHYVRSSGKHIWQHVITDRVAEAGTESGSGWGLNEKPREWLLKCLFRG